MTRIASFAQSQALLQQLMQAQTAQAKTQEQIATGKVAQSFKDIPKEAGVLLSAKSELGRVEQYMAAADVARQRLERQDLHLESMADAAQTVREAVNEAIANGSAIGMMQKIEGAFRQAAQALNAQVDGRFVFGGTRTDAEPFTGEGLADLVAAGAAGDLFQNNDLAGSLRVDDGYEIRFGMLADALGEDFMATVKQIADYDDAFGPLDGELSEADRTFLAGVLPDAVAAREGLVSATAANGQRLAEVERVAETHQASKNQIEAFVADIEEVDLAEAIARLNQDRLAVEASTSVLARLNSLSLLDFLR